MLTAAKLDRIENGMTKEQVQEIIGQPGTILLSIGPSETLQWIEGEDDSTRSIVVNFQDGKSTQKAGSNLP